MSMVWVQKEDETMAIDKQNLQEAKKNGWKEIPSPKKETEPKAEVKSVVAETPPRSAK